MKKKIFGIVGALAVLLMFGLVLAGCSMESDTDDESKWPSNINNTSWMSSTGRYAFTFSQGNKLTIVNGSGGSTTVKILYYTLKNAVSNGKMTATADNGGKEYTLCTSYSINNNKITFSGSDFSWGTYTKQ